MFSFGAKEPKLTPKEQTRKWTRELKREQRGLDRQIGSECPRPALLSPNAGRLIAVRRHLSWHRPRPPGRHGGPAWPPRRFIMAVDPTGRRAYSPWQPHALAACWPSRLPGAAQVGRALSCDVRRLQMARSHAARVPATDAPPPSHRSSFACLCVCASARPRPRAGIEREEAKIQREIKKAAKAKPANMAVIKTLAKELVRSRKAKERIYTSRATLNSVSMQLQNQLAMATMAGAISKSTEIMTSMGRLVSAPAIAETMRNMAREMERAGLIEEMMEDTMEMMDDDDVEDEAEEEVAKTIAEIVGADFAGVAAAPSAAPAVAAKPAAEAEAPAKVEEGEEDMAALRARLEAL